MSKPLSQILQTYQDEKGALIPVLQEAQREFGYLSEEAVSEIAKFLGASQNEIYGVATFYDQFRFTPPAQHTVKVCLGTACHVRGGTHILDKVGSELGIQPGGITKDHQFGLERIACFGCCALAAVMVVDDVVYGKVTASKAKEVLAKYGWESRKT